MLWMAVEINSARGNYQLMSVSVTCRDKLRSRRSTTKRTKLTHILKQSAGYFSVCTTLLNAIGVAAFYTISIRVMSISIRSNHPFQCVHIGPVICSPGSVTHLLSLRYSRDEREKAAPDNSRMALESSHNYDVSTHPHSSTTLCLRSTC